MTNDLISRSAHIDKFTAEAKKIAANDKDFAQALMYVVTCLDAAPAVDAVEVVRCQNCKHSGMYCFGTSSEERLACLEIEEDGFIGMATAVKPDFFCANGERRNDGA